MALAAYEVWVFFFFRLGGKQHWQPRAPKGEHSYLILNQLGGVSMFDKTYQNGLTSDRRSLPNPDKDQPRLLLFTGASDRGSLRLSRDRARPEAPCLSRASQCISIP